MGRITKSMRLNVPPNIAYDLIKEHFWRKWIRIYCADLLRSLLVDYTLIEDVPDSKVVFVASRWKLFRTEETFIIEPLGSTRCEITIEVKFRAISGSSAKAHVTEVIGCMLMLERGFNAGTKFGR